MDKNEKYLIANTTREEREQIVRDSLSFDAGCEDDYDGMDMYWDYIIGRKELAQINAEFKTEYISELPDEDSGMGCGMGSRR